MNEEYSSIGIIGDEDTLYGFMISGIQSESIVQVTSKTPEEELKKIFVQMTNRKDLALLLVCDFVYDKLRVDIENFDKHLPSIIEIPSRIK